MQAEERQRAELQALRESAAGEVRTARQTMEAEKAAALKRAQAEREEAEEALRVQVERLQVQPRRQPATATISTAIVTI